MQASISVGPVRLTAAHASLLQHLHPRTLGWCEAVLVKTTDVARQACTSYENVAPAVDAILARDFSPLRTFGLLVGGALAGEAESSLPVALVSTSWWAGAEAFDDILDRDGTEETPSDIATAELSVPEALIASTVCLTVLPQLIVERYAPSGAVRALWTRDVAAATLHAAAGQISDTNGRDEELSFDAVVRTYAAKTGAAYARDAVMAARLVTDDRTMLDGWRTFGRVVGVLRQLHNDRTSDVIDESDLRNGTHTLLVAHAARMDGGEREHDIRRLRRAAVHDDAAGDRLRELVTADEVVSSFNHRISGMYAGASDLLARLAPPSGFRDGLQGVVDLSAGFGAAAAGAGEVA
jgi:heptaprenyl diphosphate synthase